MSGLTESTAEAQQPVQKILNRSSAYMSGKIFPIRLYAFGNSGTPPMLCGPDGAPVRLPNGRHLSAASVALLIYLRTQTGAHTKEKLAKLFWGEGESARHSLDNALSSLRQVLPQGALAKVREAIKCVAHHVPCDYHDFRSAKNPPMDRFRAYQPEFGRVPGLPFGAKGTSGYEKWRANKEKDARRDLDVLWASEEKRMEAAGLWSQMVELGVLALRWDPSSEDAVLLALRGYGGQRLESQLTSLYESYKEALKDQNRRVPTTVRLEYERQFELCGRVPDGEAETAPSPPATETDLFVAAPMTSHLSDAAWADQQEALEDVLRSVRVGGAPLTIYHAGKNKADRHDTDDPGIALAANIDQIRRCRSFLLIYRKNTGPTSALVELGAALALHRPTLVLVERDSNPPYLLGNLQWLGPWVRTIQFRNWEELGIYLRTEIPELIERGMTEG